MGSKDPTRPNAPHFFETFDPARMDEPGEWCKHCNCAKAGDGMEHFDRNTFADYVTAHGFGEPAAEGYALAERLMIAGDDYATAAAEIVARSLTSPEWSGSPDPADPDNFWIDDATGERVNAATGERSAG